LGELLRRHAHLKLGITSFAIVSFWPQTDFAVVSANVGFQSDCVAKVVLQKVSKILKAAGAIFV
jgi:hypothetical protein